MSHDYTSKDGWPQSWGNTSQAMESLKSWGESPPMVRIQVGRDREAFEWCIERLGHYEVNSSYGVTIWTKWVGPLFKPDGRVGNVFIFKDVQDAALFRMFFG